MTRTEAIETAAKRAGMSADHLADDDYTLGYWAECAGVAAALEPHSVEFEDGQDQYRDELREGR